jgi:hypothetical protein
MKLPFQSTKIDVGRSPQSSLHSDSGVHAMDYLGDERFACSKVNGHVRIIDRFGRSHLVPPCGSEGGIPVTDAPIPWHCGGGGAQDWSPPTGCTHISVTRAENGAGHIQYFRN